MMEDRLNDVVEEADKKRALKDVAEAIVKEKVTTIENAEAWAWGAEKDRAQAE